MRGGRSFLVLVVIALALGGYIYFVESEREPRGASVVPGEKVFALEPGTLEEVRVRAASGETTTVRKTGDTWQIVDPAAIEADASAVSSLVSTLESLESQRTVDENPASLAPYGLDPPRISVEFRKAGETDMKRLDIGDRTPTGADLYARAGGDPRLILIASYLEDSLDKSTFELRNKSVLKVSRDNVDMLQLDRKDGPDVVLARAGDDWRLTAPVDARADYSAVDGLIGRVSQARMQSIVSPDDTAGAGEPTAAELKEFGLAEPELVATLGEGSNRAVLAVGAAQDGSRYARDLSRPLVFTIEGTLYDELTREADDLRSKDLFEFRSFTAQGIDLTLDAAAYSFRKEPAPEGQETTAPDTWKLAAPEARDVDQSKLAELLTTLSNLRAESFASRPATGGRQLVVVARFGDAATPETEQVVLRKSGETVHAIREGEPGAAVVPAADFDRVVTLLEEITRKQ